MRHWRFAKLGLRVASCALVAAFAPLLSLALLIETLVLASSVGVLAAANLPPMSGLSNASTVASGSSVDHPFGRGLASWDVRDFGAKCDDATDDEPAFAAALKAAMALYAAGGKKMILRIAAGTCLLDSGTLPAFYIPSGTGGASLAIIGDGPHQSTIRLGPGYSGNALSLSEAWNRANYVNPFSPASDFSGIMLQGLFHRWEQCRTLTPKNGIMFYDRNDFVSIPRQ